MIARQTTSFLTIDPPPNMISIGPGIRGSGARDAHIGSEGAPTCQAPISTPYVCPIEIMTWPGKRNSNTKPRGKRGFTAPWVGRVLAQAILLIGNRMENVTPCSPLQADRKPP